MEVRVLKGRFERRGKTMFVGIVAVAGQDCHQAVPI
jgi:hypothetical protein